VKEETRGKNRRKGKGVILKQRHLGQYDVIGKEREEDKPTEGKRGGGDKQDKRKREKRKKEGTV